MKTKQVISLVSFLSIISFIISCEENSDIKGAYEGEKNQTRVYLHSYIVNENGSSDTDYVESVTGQDRDLELLVTSPRSGGKIIKEYSQLMHFETTDDEGYSYAPAANYYIVNINALYSFLYNVVYDTYIEDDKDEVVEAAVERFNEWLVDNPNQNASQNQYKERVFFYGDGVLFSQDLNEEFSIVVSKAFFLSYTKTGNTEYVIEQKEPAIDVYLYDDVLAEDIPTKFSKFDIKLTYQEMKYIPDF